MNIHQKLQRNIVGGIVSGIGSIIGGVINAGTHRKINERNLEEQKAENERSRQFTEHMYNTYESPAAQMQQMQEAGLNPLGAVSPQSVGSASTSSLPSAQAPQWGDAIINAMPSFYQGLLSAKEARAKDLEATAQELENWRTAFENGNAEEMYELQKQQIEETIALTREQKREKRRLIRELDFTYKKAKEAYDNGINEFVDEHNASVADTNKTNAETDTINQLRVHLVQGQKLSNQEIAQRTENLKKEYDILKEQASQMSNDTLISNIQTQLSSFFGIDIGQLIPSLQYKAAEYYRDFVNGDYTYDSTIKAFNEHVNRILEKDGHIVESSSTSSSYSIPNVSLNGTVLKQSFGFSIGGGSQSTSTSYSR